ncbi:unnamed protein product [Spodoptera littoralis]|uniref:FAM194 C-terminal domain-containing protein n=1 Tax=Spodoptera littoralis TaxID=7109 RepID=A0A9P0IGQ8_SPOLI|nr:unnamed protein product [Spodoptera littoralis]CAH1647460.1 unnamed protein product [Spodoptera littoralis]
MILILQTGLADGSDDTFIVCNTGKRKLKKEEYISELYRYKSKCTHCKKIVHKVRHLLDEFKIINENEIIGICKRCRQSCKIKCPRCEYIKNKFVDTYKRHRKERQERFKDWLCKVNELLQSLIDGEGICHCGMYKDAELERLLQDLKEPLDVRQPDIDFFPNVDDELLSLQDLKDSKILLEELLSKMKPEAEEHAAHLSVSKGICICKDLKEKHLEEFIPGFVAKPLEESQATILTGEHLKYLDTSPSLEECKHFVKRLIILSQNLPRGIHLNKEFILDLIDTIDIGTKQGLSVNIVNKLIDQLKQLDKYLDYDMSPELDKNVIITLIGDLNDLLTIGSSKTVNKELLKLLIQLTNLLTTELKKQHSSHLLLKDESKYKKHGKEIDETLHVLYPTHREKSGTGYKKHGPFETPTPDVGPLGVSPGKPKGKIKDKELKMLKSDGIEQRRPKSHDKKLRRDGSLPLEIKGKSSKIPVMRSAPSRVESTLNKYILPPIFGKEEKSSTQTEVGKETEIIAKSRTKKSLSKISKITFKKSLSIYPKKIKTYGGGEGLMKRLSKASILSKRGLAKKYVPPKDATKTKLVGKKENLLTLSINEIATLPHTVRSFADTISSLIQVLGNINRALAVGGLNKRLLQQFAMDVRDILGETPTTLLHNIIKQLLQLSKPVLDGVPDDTTLKLVQELISHATKALCHKLSANKNKAMVNELLSNLNNVLMSVSKEWQSKHKRDTQKSRDLRYLSKAISKRIQDLSNRQLVSSQSSLYRETKSKQSLGNHLRILQEKLAKGKTIYSLETAAALKKIKKKNQEEKLNHLEIRSRSGISTTSTQQLKKAKKLSEAILGKILQCEANEKIERKKKEREAKELESQATLTRISSRAFNLPAIEAIIASPPSSSTSSTSSVIETCLERKPKIPKVMIRGERIVPYDAEYIEHLRKGKPPILKTQRKRDLPESDRVAKETDSSINLDEISGDGILKYRLSNRQFIEKGWTILPTKKVMRRVLSDSGMVIVTNIYFPESNVGQRYVVYSSGDEVDHGSVKPRTIIALFDVQGNGVVYDHNGNVRLKYNQSEGVLVDSTLGSPCKWKWHTLNDPPVLQHVILNPQLKVRDSIIEHIGKTERALDSNPINKRMQPEMLAIELENFAREKTFKLTQKFKKLEIKMKAVKLNEHFSLKIIDQTTIHLYFRDGTTSLKLNLGMVLISDEIVDTDTAELTDVQTPYDRFPAKSPSVEDIQLFLKTVNLRNRVLHATRA